MCMLHVTAVDLFLSRSDYNESYNENVTSYLHKTDPF